MRITRRRVLQAGAALPLLPRAAWAATEALTAGAHRVQLAPETFPTTAVWAYDAQVPGPVLRVPQGGRFARAFVNDLPVPSTVHWHGVRVPNAMDGVPGLTQDPVPPGGTFDYAFDVPDAGTYWYHSHVNAAEQVPRGLAGPLIVDEADPPEIDADHVLMLQDWRLVDPADIAEDFDSRHDASHAGRIGNFVTVNGAAEARLAVKRHDRLRLRVINAAPARIFELGLRGLDGWIVAVDGMPVAEVLPISQVFLAPGARADLVVDVTGEVGTDAFVLEIFQGEGFALASLPIADGAANRREKPGPLPPNPGLTEPDLEAAAVVPLTMEGGAMRGLGEVIWQGEIAEGRALAEAGQFWALSGEVGLGPEPFAEVARGESLRIPFLNQTAFPHAMHLHGHHMREVYTDGTLGPARDTMLVDPGQLREVAVLADNPGDWLFHCHMLSHHAAGMGTWIRVGA